MKQDWLAWLACAAPLVVFLAIYVPAAGHGFVKDDFGWILQSRAHSPADVAEIFRKDNGFYRPIVALTFTVDEWLFGTTPRGYGLTNVLLALACAAAVVRLAQALLQPAYAGHKA